MAAFASFRERFSSRAVRVFPGPFDLTRTALGTLFSYGFPTKPCAAPYGSYDNLWWITWHYIYQLLIYPYLTYGFASWVQSLKTHLNKILILQKRAPRMIFFADRRDHAIPFFVDANILPLSFLYYEYVSNFMHDINNNNAPLWWVSGYKGRFFFIVGHCTAMGYFQSWID